MPTTRRGRNRLLASMGWVLKTYEQSKDRDFGAKMNAQLGSRRGGS